MLLFAAGETIGGATVAKHDDDGDVRQIAVPDYMIRLAESEKEELSLKSLCRTTVRKHLMDVDSVNLFVRIPRLRLWPLLTEYLLYEMSLDKDYNDDADDDDENDDDFDGGDDDDGDEWQ